MLENSWSVRHLFGSALLVASRCTSMDLPTSHKPRSVANLSVELRRLSKARRTNFACNP